ncbi:hypothetical protein M427DRAFT_66928 [Gonapodya prolifera JEL478]|uniref:ADF-H domain-containing protein n=1 Tax=Gonapodya prolifera (strain JEL478) TaxID=1344416 RepID=A0A139ASU5_GONPJ|nr:hypothetical protein M427DRAFT_66928 [Gonapodya prolifera JEL478]|eukprot:KXS19807.1 hypothetical protein M427DRAFT_66928 [Gonapodya prolifera JEL478]
MAVKRAPIIVIPDLDANCAADYKALANGVRPAHFMLVYKLSDDEKSMILEHKIPYRGSSRIPWSSLEDLLPDQNPRWIFANVEYVMAGGDMRRNKVLYVAWSPDTITRPTMRESARVKSLSVLLEQVFLPAVGAQNPDVKMQANCKEDLDVVEVLKRVSRFERGGEVNMDMSAFALEHPQEKFV